MSYSMGEHGTVLLPKLTPPEADRFFPRFWRNNADCEYGGDLYECSLAVGSDGSIYVAGLMYSNNFPVSVGAFDTTYNGSQDAFVTKLTPDGATLQYSTYIGGSGNDCFRSCAIAVDAFGAAYVVGSTTSTNFPGAAGSYGGWDVFLVKLSSTGSGLGYTLRLGGGNDDVGYDVAVDFERPG